MPYRPVSLDQAFDLLGLMPDAMPDDVKRAYRKLAMQWHPDRNPSPEATERFRQVRAAYDFVLSGGETVGPDAAEATSGTQTTNDAAPERGPDQHETIWLTLEEAIFGTAHTFELGEAIVCETCSGAGKVDLGRSCLCEACHGSGRIRAVGGLAKCDICGGRGFVSVVPCEDCEGSGALRSARKVLVTVPPLMWPGRRLRLAGQAEPQGDLLPGDLMLEAQIKPHALYRVAGEALVMDMPVSGFDVLFGRTLRVPVPGGEAELSIMPTHGSLSELSLDGHGLPRRDGGRGALRVQLEPQWPDLSAPEDRALLEMLKTHLEARLAETLPAVAAWRERWLGTLDAAVAPEPQVEAASAGEDGPKARKSKAGKSAGKRKSADGKTKSTDGKSRRKKH